MFIYCFKLRCIFENTAICLWNKLVVVENLLEWDPLGGNFCSLAVAKSQSCQIEEVQPVQAKYLHPGCG